MILPSAKDVQHKVWLFRILSEIADDAELSNLLRFKGGTCAAMQGLINRFSVDLDFDLIRIAQEDIDKARKNLEIKFKKLDLIIKDRSSNVPQYFLKYKTKDQGKDSGRSIIKIDVTFPAPNSNQYEPVLFTDIDKTLICQTPQTMFANKLVALLDRFEKNKSIAGRDLFDIQEFAMQGIKYETGVIVERRNQAPKEFFKELDHFIRVSITQEIIDQDLNTLLPYDVFKKIRKFIKSEVLLFVKEQIEER